VGLPDAFSGFDIGRGLGGMRGADRRMSIEGNSTVNGNPTGELGQKLFRLQDIKRYINISSI
jgi:hypothetical protein